MQFNYFLKANIDIESTKRRLYLVLYTNIFTFLFLIVFEPFGLFNSKTDSSSDVFAELGIAMLLSSIVLLFSQFVLRNVLKIKIYSVIRLVFWFCFEMILIGAAWGIVEFLDHEKSIPLTIFLIENITGAYLVFLIPYVSFIGLIKIYKVSLLPSPQNTNNENTKIKDSDLLALKDENNTIKLSIKPDNLLMIQSADNYLAIKYIEHNKVCKFLLRNSIKKLEKQLFHSSIIRCHRSYMINTKRIETSKKVPSGFVIKMQMLPETEVPVSKSYVSHIKRFL